MSMMELDAQRFQEAWLRAFWWQHDDDDSLVLSRAEMPLLKLLWAIQVALERYYGWPVGTMPENPVGGWAPNRLSAPSSAHDVHDHMHEHPPITGSGVKTRHIHTHGEGHHLMNIPIYVDPVMSPGTVEIRGQDGEVLGRIVNPPANEDGGGT